MPTVSRGLPKAPHLDIPKREARALLKDWRARTPEALERVIRRHPRFRKGDAQAISGQFALADAQSVIAREYGFSTWADMKQRIDGNTAAGLLLTAVQSEDSESVVRILRAHPDLLHIPLWSGNWGPPMSHAANLGKLEIIKAIAALGARDHDHALDRAILQGQIETARWLHQHGGKLKPGAVLGPCETLNPAGLNFLIELGAALEDARANRLAPLGLVLETYCRNPEGKHAVLEILGRQGYRFPATPMMALHRGDLDALGTFLLRDPNLIHRRFRLPEIYPAELGCGRDGRSGMHWTPLEGTTLMHIAIDFDELEAFNRVQPAAPSWRGSRCTCDDRHGRIRRTHSALQRGGESLQTPGRDGSPPVGARCFYNSPRVSTQVSGLVRNTPLA